MKRGSVVNVRASFDNEEVKLFFGLLFDTMSKIYHFSIHMKRVYALIMIVFSFNSYAMAPKLNWDQAVDRAVQRYGLRVEPQLKSYFSKAGVSYPPREVALLAFKSERKVELWAKTLSNLETHS